MQECVPLGWAGIDVGKGHHWVCLIDENGTTVWSVKVVNDEAAILDAVGSVLARAEGVVWGVDVTGTMSGLLLALLAAHGQRVRYVPGRTVNQMAGAYRGEAKTDALVVEVVAQDVRLVRPQVLGAVTLAGEVPEEASGLGLSRWLGAAGDEGHATFLCAVSAGRPPCRSHAP